MVSSGYANPASLSRATAIRGVCASVYEIGSMTPVLNLIILYARDMQRTATFYQKYFGFITTGEVVEGVIELAAPEGGASILVLQAARTVKLGQVGVKLTFSVPDVEAFKVSAASLGLEFGSTHQANGYAFANTKDPDGNSVSISSRAYRTVDKATI